MPDSIIFHRRANGRVNVVIPQSFTGQQTFKPGYHNIDPARVSVSTDTEGALIYLKSEVHHVFPQGIPVTEISGRPSDNGPEVVDWLADNFFFEDPGLLGYLQDTRKVEAAALLLDALMEWVNEGNPVGQRERFIPDDNPERDYFLNLLDDIY